MPELTKVVEMKRVTQVLEVMTILFENDRATVEEACRITDIAPSTYYRWVNSDGGVIESLRGLIGDQQRRILITVAKAREEGVMRLVIDAVHENTSTKDRVLAMRYLDAVREELELSHHAAPGIEEDAHAFLKEGPIITQKESRLASIKVRTGTDPDEVIVDVITEQDVIDITPNQDD